MQKHAHLTNPTRSNRRNRHNAFARLAVIDAFGWHHAKALDQGNFIDRPPSEFPGPSPEARFR